MIDTKSIREKIIDLAISGKLTEHYEGDSIIELENAIKILGNKERRFIDDSEKWTDIPSNWDWTTLASITNSNYLGDGNWVLSSDMVANGEVKLIQLGCIGDCVFKHKGFKYLTEEHFKELNGKQIYPGYLLINRLVVDKMVACIIPEIKGILCTAVDVCWVAPNSGIYDIQYLMYALSSTEFRRTVKELGHGVTRFRISKLNLIDIAFPFPPLAEQKRIVSAVEDAFAIIDRIENAQESYYADQEVLKNKIIDAGIRGKLTEQLPEDGNAEDLYVQIQEEKARLIAGGRIKKEKPLPPIAEDEVPFEIPKNWKWVRLGDISTYGIKNEKIQPCNMLPEQWLLELEDIEAGGRLLQKTRVKDRTPKGEKVVFSKGNILYSKLRPYLKKVLIAEDDGIATPEIIPFKSYAGTEHGYLKECLISTYFDKAVNQRSFGVKMPRVDTEFMRNMLIPLPPLAEQKRIVKRIYSFCLIC